MISTQEEKCGVYLSTNARRLYFTVVVLWSSKLTYWVFKYKHVNWAPPETFQQTDKDACMSIKTPSIMSLLGLLPATKMWFCSLHRSDYFRVTSFNSLGLMKFFFLLTLQRKAYTCHLL